MKNKVIIVGYFGAHNLGDECILRAALGSIKNKTDFNIVVRSVNPNLTSLEFGVESFFASSINFLPSLFRNMRLFKRARYLIIGPGGLLNDITGISLLGGNTLFIFQLLLVAKIFRIKFILYSLGIGPINSWHAKLLAKFIIKEADLVGVRTEGDKAYIREIFKNNLKKEVFVTGDTSLLLNGRRYPAKRRDGLFLGVNLREYPFKSHQKRDFFIKGLNKTFDFMIEQYNAKLIFLPFQSPQDNAFYFTLKERLKDKILLFKESYALEEMLDCISGLDLVIAMRLHAAILSSLTATPFICLSYDPKVDYFLEDLGYSDYSISLERFDPLSLKSKFISILNNDNAKAILEEKVDSLREKTAKRQDSFISGIFNL